MVAVAAGVVWAYRLLGIGFLSDDFVQLLDWAVDTAPPATTWLNREYCGYYRPLSALVWRLEYLLWGMDAGGYRLCNLALHGGCAACLFYVTRQLGLLPRAALVAALLFGINPGHIIGVLSISGVAGTLCAALYMASLAAHLRAYEGGWAWRAVSLAAFAAALLTKESAASLPLLFLTLHLLVLRSGLRYTLYRVGPYFALSAGYLGLRFGLFGHLPQAALAHKGVALWTIATNTVLYGGTSLFPWGLDWLKPAFRGYSAMLALVCGVLLAVGAASALLLRRRLQRLDLFWAVWFGLTLAPAVRLYSPWNSYLPAMGTSVLLVRWLYRTGSGWRVWGGRALLYIWLASATIYQFVYQADWLNASDLSERIVEATAQVAAGEKQAWYLAGIPAEYRGVPVFGGSWGLDAALRMRGGGSIPAIAPVVLPVVHYEHLDGGTAALLERGGTIGLQVTGQSDFFRLNEVDVMSHKVDPAVGFTYDAGQYAARVTRVNSQGQPCGLDIKPEMPLSTLRVWTWDGVRLAPAIPAAAL